MPILAKVRSGFRLARRHERLIDAEGMGEERRVVAVGGTLQVALPGGPRPLRVPVGSRRWGLSLPLLKFGGGSGDILRDVLCRHLQSELLITSPKSGDELRHIL